jgi:metal-sulfur cluster biosynthetic enzyme
MNEILPQPSPTADTVFTCLHHLIDPEVGVNLVDLGMIDSVSVSSDGAVVVRIAPTTPGCPMHDVLADGAKALVGNLHGVTAVDVEFVYDPPWTPARITPAGREALSGR